MKFALATANHGKIAEISEIVAKLGIEIITRDELNIDFDVEETGTTFYENALLKAQAISIASGLPAIADDSGLCIDGLDGAPGVYSSSFGGLNLSDSERCEYLLNILKNVEHRGAKFVCYIVCYFPNGKIITAVGECRGEILETPQGTNGFGYDPIFRAEDQIKSMAELTGDKKNEISHRGKALKAFSELLMSYVNEQ